jgi:hypothetical protein
MAPLRAGLTPPAADPICISLGCGEPGQNKIGWRSEGLFEWQT